MRNLLIGVALVSMQSAALYSPAAAGEADVVAVTVAREAPGSYRFDVTLRHADAGWDHYANAWEVVGPDGRVLGKRVLLHPHVDQQPFTRSLSGVVIPADVRRVTLRAHDSVHGYGGVELTVDLPLD
ncbi:MAG: hypothetical protein ACE5H8_15360 [Alphaproteobacteria bacterium]